MKRHVTDRRRHGRALEENDRHAVAFDGDTAIERKRLA